MDKNDILEMYGSVEDKSKDIIKVIGVGTVVG